MSLFARVKSLFQRSHTHPATVAPKPPLLTTIDRLRPARILEVGMADQQRAQAMIEAAQAHCAAADVYYTGIGPFESDPAAPGGLVLRDVHKSLRHTGAKVRLIPGQPLEALVAWANALGQFDLIVFALGVDPQSHPRACFFLPRLLHSGTEVYRECATDEGAIVLEKLDRPTIDALAAAAMPRRKAA